MVKRKIGWLRTAASGALGAYQSYGRLKRVRKSVKTKFKTRRRGAGSRTRTRKAKNKFKLNGSGHWSLTKFVKYPFKSAADRRDSKIQGSYTETETRTEALSSGAGVQAQNTRLISSFCSPQELYNLTLLSGEPLKNMFLKKAKYNLYGTNATNSSIYVKIWHVIATKRNEDTLDEPNLHWSTGLANQSMALHYQMPGAVPTASKLFCQNWKVIDSWNWNLAGGESFSLHYTHEINRIIQGQQLSSMVDVNGSLGQGSIKGLTQHFMISLHGMPVNDSGIPAEISLASAKVNLVKTVEYTSQRWQNRDTTGSYINTLPTVFTTGAQLVDVGQTNVEALASA